MPQPLEDEAQVVADGAHDGVDPVAEAAVQEVSAEVAIGLAMTDGGSPSELLLDLPMDAAFLAGFENPERLGRIVAPVARVFETYEYSLDAACEAWNRLIDQPWRIMSIGLRDWAHNGHSF